ncbi:ESPR-type extended signal peptide-containing protein [Megasphaera hexanoica]|nr:ESPR-type extended signal peptide-containing protein [Megasphaera hexanoica]
MNRIYKVIWSKVKHQYVVVSELAHRDGKWSSAASKSMRSRIAALAVCGAIAVFGVLPIQQVFAAADSTNPSQYIAIKVPSDKKQYDSMVVRERNDKYYLDGNSGFNAPAYVKQKLTYMENGKEVTAEFFVRDGYTVEAKYGERHDNTSNNLQISAYKNSDAPSNADDGLLTSTQILGTSSEYKTLVGQSLIDTSAGKFGGAVNSPSAGVTSGAEFFTKDKKLSYSQNFKTVEWNDAKNLYQYKGRDVALQNVYVIDGKAGVFVVENDEVYTGTVFGKNNELLTTATDKNGTYYSTWSAEIEDLNTPLTLTKANFDQAMKNVGDSIKLAAGNDIEKVVSTAAQNGNGGSIDLLRQGEYDTESGTYSKDKPKVNGTLSIISTGGTDGEDVAVQFQANGSQPFTVNAGSKVEANKKEVTSPTTSLETLTINGNTYNIPAGKTYSVSDGITISDENAISVNAGNGLEFAETADVDGTKKLQVNAGQGIVVDGSGVSVDIVQNGNLYFADGKLNSKDYRLIKGTDVIGGTEEQPAYGYKVNEDGTVELTVQDGTDESSKQTVTIADVASKSALDDMGKTLEGAVMYDKSGDTYNYTSVTLGKADNKYGYDESGKPTGGVTLTNVAYAVTDRADKENYIGSAAVNVDLLNDTVSTIKQSVADSDMHLVNGKDVIGGTDAQPELGYKVTDNQVNLKVEGKDASGETVSETVTIANMAEASDLGDINDIDKDLWNKDETGATSENPPTVVDAINNMNGKVDAVDEKVGDLNYVESEDGKGNVVTNNDDVTTSIGKLDGAIGDLQGEVDKATQEAGKHSIVSVGNGLDLSKTEATDTTGANYNVSLKDDFTLGGKDGQTGSIEFKGSEGTLSASGNIGAGSFTTGDIKINAEKDGAHTGVIEGLSNTTWNQNVIDAVAADTTGTGAASVAATQGQLKTATEGMVQYDRNEDDGSVDKGSITFAGENGTTLKNVAAGEVSATSTQAVNGSQLWQTNQAVINNSNNIQMLSNSVNKLDNRIDRVGAGAAALAALHPLDFDPDAKWDFAAGYGNYRGANAVAVGAYYRPNEDVMFSVGGTFGNGENMINAGVSLKIGAGSSHVTTSRVAMAKEIKSMRDIVAKQDAQIQKLTAMVNALVGVQTETDSSMFPDVPENHWAYEAVEAMAKSGLVKGYPDGEFKGDRTMTRYEFAQIVYNAIQAGAEVDARLVEEFKPELQFFHIATVAKDKDGNPTIERVRAN